MLFLEQKILTVNQIAISWFLLLLLKLLLHCKPVPLEQDPHLRAKVILHVKQTIIIYKHNTQTNHNNHVCYYVYISTHLYGLCLIIMKRLTSDRLLYTKDIQ